MREFPQSEKKEKKEREGRARRKKLVDKEELTTGKNEMTARRGGGDTSRKGGKSLKRNTVRYVENGDKDF